MLFPCPCVWLFCKPISEKEALEWTYPVVNKIWNPVVCNVLEMQEVDCALTKAIFNTNKEITNIYETIDICG